MGELMEASLSFPTAVFTVAFGIVLVYWVFVLLGTLDIDLFHADGAGDGADVGDAGGGDAGGHDAGGHDGGDGSDADGDGDADADGHGGFSVWHGLGLGAVPLTISISMIVLVSYTANLLLMHYVLTDAAMWVRALMVPGTILASLPFAAVLVKPVAPVFRFHEGKRNADYVGHICTINTGHVDDKFGDAKVNDNGTVLIIQVRCDQAGKLARGDKALIIEFDTERQAFLVEPAVDMLPPVSKA